MAKIIKIGETVTRTPCFCIDQGLPLFMQKPQTGKVIYINGKHQYYTIQYYKTGLKESFKCFLPQSIAHKPKDEKHPFNEH